MSNPSQTSSFSKWLQFSKGRIQHKWVDFRLKKPAQLDHMVRFRLREKAVRMMNIKFNTLAPVNLRRASSEYKWVKWDFMGAAKFLLQCKPETVVAILGTWKKHNPDAMPPAPFKVFVMVQMWLTIPWVAFTPEILAMESDVIARMPPPKKADAEKLRTDLKTRPMTERELRAKLNQTIFDHQLGDILFIMAEAEAIESARPPKEKIDLTAFILVNIGFIGSVGFLERTSSAALMPVLRFRLAEQFGGNEMTKVKLLYALRKKNPDCAAGWLAKFPIEEAAQIRAKFLELDEKSINEFRLKNEEMKIHSETIKAKHDQIKLETDQTRFRNEDLKQRNERISLETQLNLRENSQKSGAPQVEQQQNKVRQSLQESVSDLASTLNKLLNQLLDDEKPPAPPRAD